MELKPVKSTNIDAIGYDFDQQELQIQFKDGAVYAYDGVPHFEYEDFINAPSIGKYFHAKVRDKYNTRKLRSKEQPLEHNAEIEEPQATNGPAYKHNCKDCVFLGQTFVLLGHTAKAVDLYVHRQSWPEDNPMLICRSGDDYFDHCSCLLKNTSTRYAEFLAAAELLKLQPKP